MTFVELWPLFVRYGPSAITLGEKLVSAIAAGRGNQTITPEDWAELKRLSNQTAEDIYAKLGVVPPTQGDK